MSVKHSALFHTQLRGPVLGFDVDWYRGRVVAIVDGADAIVSVTIGDEGFRPHLGFGESAEPPEGRSVVAVALHPTNDVVATAGWDRPIRLWRMDSSPPAPLRDVGDAGARVPGQTRRGFSGVSWSACGRYIDTHNLAQDRGERLDGAAGGCVATRWGHDGPFVRHPAADLLALAMGADASVVHFATWDGPAALWLSVAIALFVPCKVAFAADSFAAVGGVSRLHAAVFDVPSLRPRFARKLEMIDGGVAEEYGVSQALALAPDGSTLYVPGPDGEIVALDGSSGEQRGRWRAHRQMVTQLAHHPNSGRVLSAGLDGRLVISEVPLPGIERARGGDAAELVSLYPPIPGDPDSVPHGSLTIVDTPW